MKMFKYEGPGWYKMRNGEKAWVACNLNDSGFKQSAPLMGMTDYGCKRIWRENGVFEEGVVGHFDLIGPWREPRKVKLWVSAYDDGNPFAYNTRREADDWAAKLERNGIKRIACVEIEVTEGEGL